MTMFPAHRQNLSSKQNGYVGGACSEAEAGFDCFISLGGGYSDLMAEDESRTEASINNEEAGSSSKGNHQEMNVEDDGAGWLQLSLGGGHMQSTSHDHQILLPSGSGSSSGSQAMRQLAPLIFQVPQSRGTSAAPTTFFLQPHQGAAAAINSVPAMTFTPQQQQETNYNYLPLIRPFPVNMTAPLSLSSSFSGSLEQLPGLGLGLGSYYARPLHVHRRGPPSRMDLRVVDPPRRPHSGVWFMLQASQNQAKEPFLPQIPKSYLRIKDGRMTVGLLIKYLVNKLELGSESEVEITCKGYQLLSTWTIQHVRDTIWRNDVALSLVPRSSAAIDHLMVLNYGRI